MESISNNEDNNRWIIIFYRTHIGFALFVICKWCHTYQFDIFHAF